MSYVNCRQVKGVPSIDLGVHIIPSRGRPTIGSLDCAWHSLNRKQRTKTVPVTTKNLPVRSVLCECVPDTAREMIAAVAFTGACEYVHEQLTTAANDNDWPVVEILLWWSTVNRARFEILTDDTPVRDRAEVALNELWDLCTQVRATHHPVLTARAVNRAALRKALHHRNSRRALQDVNDLNESNDPLIQNAVRQELQGWDELGWFLCRYELHSDQRLEDLFEAAAFNIDHKPTTMTVAWAPIGLQYIHRGGFEFIYPAPAYVAEVTNEYAQENVLGHLSDDEVAALRQGHVPEAVDVAAALGGGDLVDAMETARNALGLPQPT